MFYAIVFMFLESQKSQRQLKKNVLLQLPAPIEIQKDLRRLFSLKNDTSLYM